ncbi:unnamed protein product [Peniophora sp. CBMAI 1063]|nr:unnamed protein product [Peniophora sp. CBMAI 1063]
MGYLIITSTVACAVFTNEVTERALQHVDRVLELWYPEPTLEEHIALHGNTALRVAMQDLAIHNDLRPILEIARPARAQKYELPEAADERVHDILGHLQTNMRALWNERLNKVHVEPAFSEAILCERVALPMIVSWATLVFLLRTRRLGPVLDRLIPAHSPYSSHSRSLLTSILRPSLDSRFLFGRMLFTTTCVMPIIDALFRRSRRVASFALSAAVWGNLCSSSASRILQSNPQVIRRVAGAGGAWSALIVYTLFGAVGEESGTIVLTLAAILPFAAAMYSPGGAVFAVAYATALAGPRAFDAARRLAFDGERYLLTERVRHLHAATAETRARESREFALVNVRSYVENPITLTKGFWSVGWQGIRDAAK